MYRAKQAGKGSFEIFRPCQTRLRIAKVDPRKTGAKVWQQGEFRARLQLDASVAQRTDLGW